MTVQVQTQAATVTRTEVVQKPVAVAYKSDSSSRSLTLTKSDTKAGRLVVTLNNPTGKNSIIMKLADLQALVAKAQSYLA